MGRGRQKAKQTKVARDLKYSSHSTDFDALQRELAGEPHTTEDVGDDDEDSDRDGDDGRWARSGT